MKLPAILFSCAVLLATAPSRAQQPQRPPRQGTVPPPSAYRTAPGNAEHGRYIVEHVAFCIECHSPRDEEGNILRGREFTGAPIPFRPPWHTDWADRAPRNRGLPGYTPELAVRLLMEGAIDRQDRQLRPPMPPFRMRRQDAADVVAYLTSLQ